MVPKISLLLCFLSFTSFAATGKWTIDNAHSPVEFLAVGKPSLLKIRGEGAKASGSLEMKDGKYNGEILVAIDEFKTGIDTRDKHMKEKYLEINKPEFAKSKVSILGLEPSCLDKLTAEKSCDFKGSLNLHGVEKPIEGKVVAKMDGGVLKTSASFKVKISDFAIQIPTFAGVSVADEVNIQADLALQ